jgi:hypothetical protein
MRRNCGNKPRFRDSADFHGDLLGDVLAIGASRIQCVSGCFYWFYIDAKIVGRPNFAGLRLQGDTLCVGNAVANLGGFSAMDSWGGVEHLDGEIAPAKLLDGRLITFALLFGLNPLGAFFIGASCLMARKENPSDVGRNDENQQRRIDQWILEDASLRRLVLRNHKKSLPGQALLHLQK